MDAIEAAGRFHCPPGLLNRYDEHLRVLALSTGTTVPVDIEQDLAMVTVFAPRHTTTDR